MNSVTLQTGGLLAGLTGLIIWRLWRKCFAVFACLVTSVSAMTLEISTPRGFELSLVLPEGWAKEPPASGSLLMASDQHNNNACMLVALPARGLSATTWLQQLYASLSDDVLPPAAQIIGEIDGALAVYTRQPVRLIDPSETVVQSTALLTVIELEDEVLVVYSIGRDPMQPEEQAQHLSILKTIKWIDSVP